MFKRIRITFLAVCILCTLTLSSCATEKTDIETVTSAPNTTFSEDQTIHFDTSITEETYEITAITDSPNVIQNLIDAVEPPQIVITENSSSEEILQAGKTAVVFFSERVDKYFEYGVNYNWKMADGSKAEDIYTDENSNSYYKCFGLYTDKANGIYVPMNYDEIKHFLMSYILLTENGFEDLCKNSPSKYIGIDGVCFLMSGDGGQAGWDYSYIKDYDISDNGNTITYNCIRFGSKENWGYDEDLTEPFSFSIVFDNGIWKIDSCSNSEAFSNFFVGLESDIEIYKNQVAEEITLANDS